MIRRNITANFIGRVWAVVSVYAFLPVYLRFLGAEAYGLVGFYTTLLGVLALADMGLTATLNREMARLTAPGGSTGDKSDLLRTYESAYACISLLVVLLIWFLAPLIARYWLQSNTLHPRVITSAIRLMGVSIALQLPANLYIGGLMGLEKQVVTNALRIGWSILQGVGAILVLWLLSPTIGAFARWQLVPSIAYCLAARVTLWRAVSPGAVRPRFKWLVFRNTWRYALGMAGLAVVSTFLAQVDRLVVSRMLPLEALGYYMVAVALASAPRSLASPIGAAVFPRFTGLVASGNQSGLIGLYRRTTSLVAVAVIPGGLTLVAFAGDFILAWTGNVPAAQQAGMAAAFLLGGQVMQALTVLPFYLALAHGYIRLNLQIGIASVVLIAPLLVLLVARYGITGAGTSWLVMNVCTLLPYMYFLHRRFLPGEFRHWCLRGVGYPLLAALPCVLLGRWLVPHTDSRLLTIGSIGLVWSVAEAASAMSVPELRDRFMRWFSKIRGRPFGGL